MGFGVNLGIECEVYVLKLTEGGQLEVPNADDDLVKACYDVKRFMDRYQWIDKVAGTINDLGWDLYSLDHEDANSQFEFDFTYADALTMCDRFIFFRMMAKQYASEEGLIATFMPRVAERSPSSALVSASFSSLLRGLGVSEIWSGRSFLTKASAARTDSPPLMIC